MFNWIKYTQLFHLEELFTFLSVILVIGATTTALARFVIISPGLSNLETLMELAVTFLFITAMCALALISKLHPFITASLIGRNLSGIGLDEREIKYAVNRRLVTVEGFYIYLVSDYLEDRKKLLYNLESICLDYHSLVYKLRTALPHKQVQELDCLIHNALAEKHGGSKFID